MALPWLHLAIGYKLILWILQNHLSFLKKYDQARIWAALLDSVIASNTNTIDLYTIYHLPKTPQFQRNEKFRNEAIKMLVVLLAGAAKVISRHLYILVYRSIPLVCYLQVLQKL